MASALEEIEMRMALSRPRARLRVASRFSIPASLLHSLRYRPPKTISADVFDKLSIAIEHQAAEQIRNLEHAISTARSIRLGIDDSNIRKAEVSLQRARDLLKVDAE